MYIHNTLMDILKECNDRIKVPKNLSEQTYITICQIILFISNIYYRRGVAYNTSDMLDIISKLHQSQIEDHVDVTTEDVILLVINIFHAKLLEDNDFSKSISDEEYDEFEEYVSSVFKELRENNNRLNVIPVDEYIKFINGTLDSID